MSTLTAYKQLVFILGALGLALMAAPVSHAQEARYVSDILYVPMRSGAGNQFRIVNSALRSGTHLKFIEENEDGSWAKVALDDGTEGWIPTQYLIDEPTGRMRLTEAEAKVARLEQANQELAQKNEQLLAENNRLQNMATNTSTERDAMARELQNIKEISREELLLKENNTELQERNQVLQTERDALVAENEILRSDQKMDYMLYGAGLVLLGIILTLIVPALVPKKGYSEWK